MEKKVEFNEWEGRHAWIAERATRYRAICESILGPHPIPKTMRAALYQAFSARAPFCFMRNCGNFERVALRDAWERMR